jgi:hypothetical protein
VALNFRGHNNGDIGYGSHSLADIASPMIMRIRIIGAGKPAMSGMARCDTGSLPASRRSLRAQSAKVADHIFHSGSPASRKPSCHFA